LERDRPIIFSPVGLGVLDLYVIWMILTAEAGLGSVHRFVRPPEEPVNA
jgi:hypothetical protein